MIAVRTGGLLAACMILASGLSGCASSNPPRLATCDGKHLRDVNVHGTVLPAPSQPAPSEMRPQTGPEARSDRKDAGRLASLRPCGGLG